MRVDPATFAAHGAALLEAAGRLFRARGLGVSVADISQAAGLTHGAFYGHYVNKDALAAAACRASLDRSAARWRARAAASPADPLGAIIDSYLTERHRDEPEDDGCTLASLGTEAAREGGAVAAAVQHGTSGLLAVLIAEYARRGPPEQAEARALGLLSVLTGGLFLARALRPDAARSAAALQAAREAARDLIQIPVPIAR